MHCSEFGHSAPVDIQTPIGLAAEPICWFVGTRLFLGETWLVRDESVWQMAYSWWQETGVDRKS